MAKVYFVGGYYKEGKFLNRKGEVKEAFRPYANVAIYDIESVLELAFVENVCEEYEANRTDEDIAWEDLKDLEKVAMVMTYVQDDEKAGLEVCASLEEVASAYKSCLYDMRIAEEEYEEIRKIQNSEGYYIPVYKKKDEKEGLKSAIEIIEKERLIAININPVMALGMAHVKALIEQELKKEE